tara:strand:+ start:926 stop:1369 length:444 start_codon:yes stop_codon:yes gene_type:complete
MDPISVNYNSLATKDNESCKYAGCTDPLSVSYDSKATDDDGTCMYFIVGEWDISFYFVGGVQVNDAYEYLYFDFYDNNSYNLSGKTIDGDFYDVIGVWKTINDFTVIQLISDTGFTENWNIIDINARYLKIDQSIDGVFHSMELDRI